MKKQKMHEKKKKKIDRNYFATNELPYQTNFFGHTTKWIFFFCMCVCVYVCVCVENV